jgi:hypothetical protein
VTNQARLDSTVRYLQNVQGIDGRFGNAGNEPSQDFSAWVAFALAADGINPQDQARPGGVDAYTFLLTHADRALANEICKPIICTTAFERELLVVDAAGTSVHNFAGFDLVGEILARQLPDGSFPFVPGGHGEVNDTVFAILGLSLVHEPAAQAAVQYATRWLIGVQNSDGSWPAQHPGIERGEVDMTGAAIQALNAAGRHGTEAEQKAIAYLRGAQEPSGGFPEYPGEGESNVASTAWAVQGIWATGENPEAWLVGSGKEPLSYMESLQQPDGHIRWKQSEEMNGVWMTAYVAPAFAGQALPIAAVPRALQRKPIPPSTGSVTSPTAGVAETGQGGESPQPGGGVIAGGGGKGAPLFSRPLPQSQGKTPGGVRLLSSTRRRSSYERSARHRESKEHHPRRSLKDRHTRKSEPPTTAIAPSETNVAHDGMGAGPAPAGVRSAAGGRSSVASVGSGQRGMRSGSAPAGLGGGGRSSSGPSIAGAGSAAQQGGAGEVKGVLIGAPSSAHGQEVMESGAPGLRSAAAGGNQTPWLAIGIAIALALAALAGTQLERRRPQVIL